MKADLTKIARLSHIADKDLGKWRKPWSYGRQVRMEKQLKDNIGLRKNRKECADAVRDWEDDLDWISKTLNRIRILGPG